MSESNLVDRTHFLNKPSSVSSVKIFESQIIWKKSSGAKKTKGSYTGLPISANHYNLSSIHMKVSMTRQEKMWPFNTGDCLIEMTAWLNLTIYSCHTFQNLEDLVL
jgi:hypothetical protein